MQCACSMALRQLVIRRRSRTAIARTFPSLRRLEVRILGAQARRADRFHFSDRHTGRFARNRTSLHLQMTAIGIAAQLAAAFDQRRVQRGGAEQRMRRSRLQFAIERVERRSGRAPIRRIASRPSRGRLPCAARPSVSISTHSKPLCAIATCRSVGSVTTAPSARQRVTSASAPMLACSSSTTQAITSLPGVEAAGFGDHPRGVDHRRHAALHVLRAAAVDAAVALGRIERRLHARVTPTVSMWPQNISERPGRRAFERADHVRAGRGRPPESRRSVRCRASLRRSCAPPPPRPRRPATSDGLIESIGNEIFEES